MKKQLEDKKENLEIEQQKKVIHGIIHRLSNESPDFYYLSTIDLSYEIKKVIDDKSGLKRDELETVSHLSPRDIQIIISLN